MYGFVITTAGEAMLARAAAGETLVLDGASVGKGVVLSAADAKALTALIDPVAEATTSSPAVAGQQISITVEYRNDMDGGLETSFALSEFGITAHVGDDPSGLLYYGSLGDAPQTVKPIDQGLDAHRFPVAIAVTGEVTVTMDYPAGGFVTWDELGDLDYDPAGSAAAVKEELENDLKTKMQHFGNITGYDTVLAAASALTVDGTFFGDPSSSIYNAADKPPGTTDVQYFVMLDGTTGQRVVLAVGYAATDEYRYFGTRDILNGAWLNEWKKLATVDELADKVGLAGNVSELGDMNLANIANQFYVIMESDAIQNLPYNSHSFNNSVVYNRGQENAVFTQTLYAPQLKTVYQRYYIGWWPEESRWSEWEQIATITSEPSTAGARAISAGTTDLTAGSSALTTGQIYLVYG